MATPYSPGTNGILSPVFMKLSEKYSTALAQAVGDSKEKVEKVIYEMLDTGILEYQKDTGRADNLTVTYSARNRVQERLQIRIMNYLLGYKLTEFTP